jgi:ABC-type glycerol-3-phosphate transport system substrate-binding protein
MKKFVGLLLIPLLLSACTKPAPEKVILNYWGVYEPAANMEEVIREYQTANPHVTIKYTQRGLKEYKQQVLARAGKENGPDIFRFHNSWVPEL